MLGGAVNEHCLLAWYRAGGEWRHCCGFNGGAVLAGRDVEMEVGGSDLGRGAWDHTPSPFKQGRPRSFVPALEHPRKS